LENYYRFAAEVELSGIAFDARTGWRYVPREARYDRKETVGFNSMGFRDVERSALPAPLTRRVLVLGDSYVAGMAVPREKTLTEAAQAILDGHESKARFELIPAAVSAWGTDQELLFLASEGLALRPSGVLLLLTPNDIRESYAKKWIEFSVSAPTEWKPRGPVPPPPGDRLMWWLADHSALFQRLQQVMGWHAGDFSDIFRLYPVTFELSPGKPAHDEDLYLKTPPPSIEAAYRYEESILSALAATCRNAGVMLRIGVIPTKMEYDGTLSDAKYDPVRVQNRVRTFANLRSIPFVDLRAEWGAQPLGNYLSDEYHFNEEGHGRAAKTVAAALEQAVIH
jgi:hypothetical protein